MSDKKVYLVSYCSYNKGDFSMIIYNDKVQEVYGGSAIGYDPRLCYKVLNLKVNGKHVYFPVADPGEIEHVYIPPKYI